MNIIFKNSYTNTKEIVKEIYQYFYFKKPLDIIFYVLFGFSFIINLVFLIMGRHYSAITMIIFPLLIAWSIYSYYITVRSILKKDNELANGNPIHLEIIITYDFVCSKVSTGMSNEIAYSKIKKVIITKNLILLHSEANLIYTIPKNTFILGTSSEFIDFLKQKGLKIKGLH